MADSCTMELEAQNRWLDTSSTDWTVAQVRELLLVIQDDQWKASAATETRAEDVEAQLAILEAGIESSKRYLDGSVKAVAVQASIADGEEVEAVRQLLDDELREAIETRIQLLELEGKARTWRELQASDPRTGARVETVEEPPNEEDVEASWQFDGDEDDDELLGDDRRDGQASHPPSSSNSLPSLPDFLDTSILQSAFTAAVEADFTILRVLFNRHAAQLNPFRLAILDRIPLFSEVSEYTDLLPQVDQANDIERLLSGEPWRSDLDKWEGSTLDAVLRRTAEQGPSPRTAEQISQWYQKRVKALDRDSGRVDSCLSLIQYGASQGVPALDALGEELSLLSKLVYGGSEQTAGIAQDWTLQKWRSSSPSEIVAAYLSNSTAETVVADIRRMALPYLFVLESQAERAGSPDPTLHERLLNEWLLNISPTRLNIAASVFEASKPTLRPAQRIVRDDLQLVRLALAIAYDYPGTSSWEIITSIFDCLPALEETASTSAEHTLSHLLSGSPPSNSASLFASLQQWSTAALSRALDAFDLHLEAAEIFARWSAPKPLSFFVSLSEDSKQQRMWADRLARTSAAAVSGRGGGLGGDFEFEDEWISLLDDLCKLAGDGNSRVGGSPTGSPTPVFNSLSQKEITKIFFAGLLSSGKFDLAKSLFNPSSGERPLDPATEQELVLAASREFYDNAETANLHSGNMKLAFDCLTVAPTTLDIRRERDFIEATSRLASFRILGSSGEPLTPLEIRLTPDKMSLISQLLRSNEDAYRHPDLVLDLVAKLGFKGDLLAETRALSLLADAALAAGDAVRAGEICDRMIASVAQIRKGRDKEKAAQAAEMAWKTCFSFGNQDKLGEPEKKMDLLGQALLLCPASEIGQVLSVWQVADSRQVKRKKRTSRQVPSTASTVSSRGLNLPSFSMPSRPHTPTSIHIPQSAESAARAALSVGRAASAYLPFRTNTPDPALSSSGRTGRDISALFGQHESRSRQPSENRSQATADVRTVVGDRLQKGFTSGIGWLIGADEEQY